MHRENNCDSDDDPSDNQGSTFSIEQASVSLGLDSFSTYALIQREKIHASRLPTGEIVLRESEVNRVLQKAAGQKEGDVC